MRETEPVLLEYRLVERIRKMLRWFDTNPQRTSGDPLYRRRDDQNIQFVKLDDSGVCESGSASACVSGTGSGSASGSCASGFYHDGLEYYRGHVEVWDAKRRRWITLGNVWVKEANDRKLKVGIRYLALQTDLMCHECETKYVFVTDGGFGRASCSGNSSSGSTSAGCSDGSNGAIMGLCCTGGGTTIIYESDVL